MTRQQTRFHKFYAERKGRLPELERQEVRYIVEKLHQKRRARRRRAAEGRTA